MSITICSSEANNKVVTAPLSLTPSLMHTQYHAQTIANVREAVSLIPGKSVAIALDTKGPEIRTGLLKGVSAPEAVVQ